MLHPGYLASHFTAPRLYRIGYWAWELPVVPPSWVPALEFVNEVWTPSSFVADAFREATKKPVRVVPHAIPPNDIDRRTAREKLQLPVDAYIFLSIFDTNSYPVRKNPEGAIAAFEDAFPDSGPSTPLLVVKIHGKANRTPLFNALIERLKQKRSIRIIDQTLSEEDMRNLQAACDCFVSLHRSEGFGLNVAECMAAGRLVITTDFSGNRDFATAENSLPIPFGVRLVQPEDYLHGRGQWWAEPDHEAAVEAMRWAVAHPSDAGELADKAPGRHERQFLVRSCRTKGEDRVAGAAVVHHADDSQAAVPPDGPQTGSRDRQ